MILRLIDQIVDTLLALLLASTVVVLGVAVWYRYVLNQSLGWSDEVTSYTLVWMIFLGSYSCTRKGLHLDFPFLVDRLPAPVRRVLPRGIQAALAAYCGFAAWQSWKVLTVIGYAKLRAIDIPRGVFLSALPICFALMAVAFAWNALHPVTPDASDTID